MRIARHVVVTGHVQGVFFRAWVRERAERLDVGGWVRNCDDGSVEAHIEGEPDEVERLLKELHQGPPSARVEEVRSRKIDPGHFNGFEVR